MNELQIHCCKPVSLSPDYIKDIAFNGCEYILLNSNDCKISTYDTCFHFVGTACVTRKYTGICFDYIDCCYWAIANNDAATIYHLDSSFKEIDHINIKNTQRQFATGISYDCRSKTIWVSFLYCVGYIEKGCCRFTYIDNTRIRARNKSILALPFCRMLAYSENCGCYIDVFRPNCHEKQSICIPGGYGVEGMCLCPLSRKDDTDCSVCNIGVLLYQFCTCTTFFMCCSIEGCSKENIDYLCDLCIDAHCTPRENICCECSNGCGCESSCGSACQIMRSIAMEETGIAHILNAEGEKIQKAVELSCEPGALLCVNESATRMITHLTQLEMQLYLKLETALHSCPCMSVCEIGNNSCEKHCDCKNPCFCESPAPCDDT